MYQTLSESALSCKRSDKTLSRVFRFKVSTAVRLKTRILIKFHKVAYRHYSSEVENIHITL